MITQLKSIFSRHGIPEQLISDNGPPFNSESLKNFCSDWEIEHVTSSPYFPRSNGLAERSIRTVKSLLKKCHETKSDPYIALLQYRTTPKGSLESPSELLMSRKLRTKLPILKKNLKPKLINYRRHRRLKKEKQEKLKTYYNKRTKNLKPLKKGEKVFYKKSPSSEWEPGTVAEKCDTPRSFIINDNQGHLYRRTREHILAAPQSVQNNENSGSENKEPIRSEVSTTESEKVLTRSGREVVAPKRFSHSHYDQSA